jgi:hypothetical protein
LGIGDFSSFKITMGGLLKMEFDDLKAAWQREMAAYSRNMDIKAITAETKRLVKRKDRIFACQQITRILCGLFCLGLMAAWYRRENPLPANVGLIVMFLCLALMPAGLIILKYRQKESHPELPEKDFLDEERTKVVARIALLRRNAIWLFIPCMLGFLTWQIELSHSVGMVVALVAIAAIAAAGMVWLYRWKLRRDLLSELEAIDRDLEDERKNRESWSD